MKHVLKHPKRCYIFDLDGTLFDCSHRLHFLQNKPKDWRGFFGAVKGDKPIPHVIELAKKLWATTPIIFVSGRSDECEDATVEALQAVGFGVLNGPSYCTLYMRRAGDFRSDDIVKEELLDKIRADGWDPIMAFDDRDRVVSMWRANGVPCAQVAEGDF